MTTEQALARLDKLAAKSSTGTGASYIERLESTFGGHRRQTEYRASVVAYGLDIAMDCIGRTAGTIEEAVEGVEAAFLELGI